MTRKVLLIFSGLLILSGLVGIAYYFISKSQSNKERTENARRARWLRAEPESMNGTEEQKETEANENKV